MNKKKPTKLKLYVWEGVFTDYTSGIAFAMARDVDHARRLIAKEMGLTESDKSELCTTPKAYSCPHGGGCRGGG